MNEFIQLIASIQSIVNESVDDQLTKSSIDLNLMKKLDKIRLVAKKHLALAFKVALALSFNFENVISSLKKFDHLFLNNVKSQPAQT